MNDDRKHLTQREVEKVIKAVKASRAHPSARETGGTSLADFGPVKGAFSGTRKKSFDTDKKLWSL